MDGPDQRRSELIMVELEHSGNINLLQPRSDPDIQYTYWLVKEKIKIYVRCTRRGVQETAKTRARHTLYVHVHTVHKVQD